MAIVLDLHVPVVIFCISVICIDKSFVASETHPIIDSMSLLKKSLAVNENNDTNMHLSVLFTGRNFFKGMSVKSTPHSSTKGVPCMEVNKLNCSNCDSYEFHELWTNGTFAIMSISVPNITSPRFLYACIKARTGTRRKVRSGNFDGTDVIKWIHQGPDIVLKLNHNKRNSSVLLESEENKNDGITGNIALNLGKPSSLKKDSFSFLLRSSGMTNPGGELGKILGGIGDSGRIGRRARRNLGEEITLSTLSPNSNSPFYYTPESSSEGTNALRSGVETPESRLTSVKASSPGSVYGIRVESSDEAIIFAEDGVPELMSGTLSVLRLFGTGLSASTLVAVTTADGRPGLPCEFPSTVFSAVDPDSVTSHSAVVKLLLPTGSPVGTNFFLCLKHAAVSSEVSSAGQPGNGTVIKVSGISEPPVVGMWVHQGSISWVQLRSYERLLPIWLSGVIIVVLLCLSGLFSGLNLGLMALDRTELKIVANTGTEKERKYARAIDPVRSHGNYLLCSLLLGNVLVNSSLTILMDDLTSGLIAIIFSTLAIVIFGEIIPQAICSRHGLAVGANTVYITKLFMVLTFPLSYPISRILDKLLGKEIGNVYNRERLKELVKVTNEYNDLENDEVNIIAGALELKKKMVCDVMTKLEDAYMLSIDAVLDFETVSEIMKQGYSRIPVYEESRSNVISLLYIKDLAFVDPDDNTPLKTLCQFYQNSCNFVFEDTTLDVMFKEFKLGIKGHMALVHRVNAEGEGDPFYETVGLVTLEDVIEELIQSEIVDETDVWTDNRTKRRRKQATKQDFTVFAERRENQRIHISPQLTLATFQYLSTTVDAFKPDQISETILRRLLKQDIIHHVKVKNREKSRDDPLTLIYVQGKPVDNFVLILEGRVEVTVGRENMMFESGPFTYFGSQALSTNIGVGESPTGVGAQAQLPSTPLQSNISVAQVQPVPSQQQTPIGSGAGSGATQGGGSAPHHGSLQSVNLDSMLRHTFVPDYTVRAITDVFYISIRRSMYLAAKRASLMERSQKGGDTKPGIDLFENELERLLHSADEDDRSRGSMDSTALSRGITEANIPVPPGEVDGAVRSASGGGTSIEVVTTTPVNLPVSAPVTSNSPSLTPSHNASSSSSTSLPISQVSAVVNPSNNIQTPVSINPTSQNGTIKVAINSSNPQNHQSAIPSVSSDGSSPRLGLSLTVRDDPEEILLLQKDKKS